ncbi:unnamed protein product [Paramecium pentaurelia]|uniref:Tubby C-terminal domain-containing protein n=1 Tax=Paramecium pentaurelia TaxID=43138 RepID=A0A8S1Y3Z3_9CILI|nr:unnamed protein product [Paramecium pentaurelia]
MFNNILPKHKQNKEQESNMGFFGQDCKMQQTKQIKKLKIDVKCMLNQEQLVMKPNKLDQQIPDVKVEYSFYVDQKYLNEIQVLQDNFNTQENVVQIIAVCSLGIKIPNDQDFHFFFECFDLLNQNQTKFRQFINNKPQKQLHRLLICSIIMKLQKMTDIIIGLYVDLNLYVLMQLTLITIQYECMEYSQYFYSLLIQYFQFQAGVYQKQITDPYLQKLIMNVAQVQIQQIKEDVLLITWGQKQLQIGTLFFKSLYKKIENRKKPFLQPLQKYQFYKTFRKRTTTSPNTDYPHYYQLLDEAQGKQYLVAYQESPHSEILIFEKDQLQYIKYSEEYVGVIERNFWGTVFHIYDYGYPKEAAGKIPKYFGQERRELAVIQYQTNIMATQPRKFTASMLNLIDNQIVQLAQMDPVYNEEKECYQLNFFGRAKRASARNFEIIDPQDQNIIYLLHGKWEKNLFNVDYRFPMSMLQAFCFSLSSISKKFLVQ